MRAGAISRFVLFLFAFCAYGQETRGTIQGRIVDPSGAPVPNVKVAAVNQATNVTVLASTNQDGVYNLLFLLPGIYRVDASAKGFTTASRDNLELRIHDSLQVDFKLEVGAISEKVEVTGESPLLQTTTANIGQVFDTKRMEDLPIPHGSPFSLIYFATGASAARASNRMFQETSNLDQFSNEMTFNGQPQGTGDWTIDGSPNIQSSKSIGPMNSPPSDIVQELKLETAFDASVGHTSGTIVNISLKSGGNQLHGTGYGFFRDINWDANTFFANAAGQPKPDAPVQKRWGASLTGPVYLPKVYDGRNRTFFTYGYEGVHRTENNGTTTTVPTPAQLNGDFSGLLAISSRYQIYDPATIKPAAGGRFSIDPFPGNIIPANRISPIAKAVSQFWPAPNVAGQSDGTNNFTVQNRAEPDFYFNHTFRVDHNISDKQRIFARGTAMRRIAGPSFYWYPGPAQGQTFTGTTKQAAIDDVYTLNARTVLNARYSYSRFTGVWSSPIPNYDPALLGFSPQVTSLLTRRGEIFPYFSVTGYLALGGGRYQHVGTDIHALTGSVSHQFSRHSLSIGTDLRANRGTSASLGSSAGRYNFATTYTQGPLDNSPSAPGGLGQGLAAFLLGLPSSGFIDNNTDYADQSSYWSLYVQDHWRVSPKLSLDLGLRWEYEAPMTERYNRSVNGFDPTATQSINAAARAAYAANPDPSLPVSQFNVSGGLLFAGINGRPRGLWDPSRKNFAPRIGFAYQVLPSTVLRGGFGVFPIAMGQALGTTPIQSGFSFATNLVPTQDSGQTFIATLANPFPGGIQPAPGASQGVATLIGQGISFFDRHAPMPYTMNWNFNVQRQLPAKFLLEAGYTGNKSLKLRLGRALDATPNQYLSNSFFRDQATINYLTANVSNPFQGLLPNTTLNGSTIQRAQLLRPYPAFTGITQTTDQGYSWYHSLQTRIERRFTKGFTAQASYTFSKKMEAISYLNGGDSIPYRTISSIDRPHTLTFTGLYELPVGKGKAIGSSFGRAADMLLGGWEIGLAWQDQSGVPIGFGDVIFIGNIKNIALPADQRTPAQWFNINAGFDRSSANQRSSNLRQFPLRLSGVRAGTYNSADASVLKNFRIHERHKFQFRGELFNVFNHPTGFDPPNTTPTSSAFGTVTSASSLPRQIQIGLKYAF